MTHIYEFARKGCLSKLTEALTPDNVDNKDISYNTVLHYSVQSNNAACVALCLANGADIHEFNGYDMTPLHLAAAKNAMDIVIMLLDAGASVNIQNTGGSSALDLAIASCYHDVAKVLMDRGGTTFSRLDWIQTFKMKRSQCRTAAILLVSIRPPQGNNKDVMCLIGKHIWSMRLMERNFIIHELV